MNIFPSPNSDEFTASAATKSASGLKVSDSEQNPASHQPTPSEINTSPSDQAHSLGHFSTSGTEQELQPCSTEWVMNGPFTMQTNGSIGFEILDADGNKIAWTTDVFVAQVICTYLNNQTNN